MEYRKLVRTSLTVSVVGNGTAPLGDMYGTQQR
jgi:aryl-alcohol dehydrogenase-like predicted oxidoreductase